MLIVTQPMGMYMAARRAGKHTITITTTTWTIRWWNGDMWVEQTIGPRIEVNIGGEATNSPDELSRDAAPLSHEPAYKSEVDRQPKHHKESER
jgi:hypothetical protein